MIHRISISNFQCIRDDLELDFRVPGTTPDLGCLRASPSRPDVRLPAVVALVGPNGSGKTTLLLAIFHALHFARRSYRNPEYRAGPNFAPFLTPEGMGAPTRIAVDFDARWPNSGPGDARSLLRYTLHIARDGADLIPTRVAYEALHGFPRGRPRRLLERFAGEPVYVARETQVRPGDDRLTAIRNLDRASAISALAAMEAGLFPGLVDELAGVRAVFPGPELAGAKDRELAMLYHDNPWAMEKLSGNLQRSDLGISSMRGDKLDGEPLLFFSHHGLHEPVIMGKESTGTQHLVRIFPYLDDALKKGQLAIMDGLDNDLHTECAIEVIDQFRKASANPNKAQLICSLHNHAILGELEKEELVIVEKSEDGATSAWFASEVSGVRRGGNLQRQYRSGILGGLPSFG